MQRKLTNELKNNDRKRARCLKTFGGHGVYLYLLLTSAMNKMTNSQRISKD